MAEPYITQSLLRGDGKLLGGVIGGPPFERMQATAIVFGAGFRRSNPGGWSREPRFDPALLDQNQQVLIKAGVQKQMIDTRRIFDETLLVEVLKEAR